MPRQKINFIALKLCEPAEFDKKFQTASFTESSTGDPAMAISCVTSAIKSFFSGLFFHDQF
jgi:hypothetical protein